MISPISYNLSSNKNLNFKNRFYKFQKATEAQSEAPKASKPQNDPLKGAKDLFFRYFTVDKESNKIKRRINPEKVLDEETKSDITRSMDLIYAHPAKNETYSIAQKYIDNDIALQYIFMKGNRPDSPDICATIDEKLLEAVTLNIDDKTRREEILDKMLFDWTNKSRQNLFEYFKDKSKNLNTLFKLALKASRDLPELQIKILCAKTSEDKIAGTYINPKDCDWQTKEEINDALYDFCIENQIVDDETRNMLFNAYKNYLDNDNKQILQNLLNQE